jgi:hypothetical protein
VVVKHFLFCGGVALALPSGVFFASVFLPFLFFYSGPDF